jgi:hypothetical protein
LLRYDALDEQGLRPCNFVVMDSVV